MQSVQRSGVLPSPPAPQQCGALRMPVRTALRSPTPSRPLSALRSEEEVDDDDDKDVIVAATMPCVRVRLPGG